MKNEKSAIDGLSAEKSIEFMELLERKPNTQNQLTLRFPYLYYGKKGYLAKSYRREYGWDYIPASQKSAVCTFIGKKKSEVVFNYFKGDLDKTINETFSPKEKINALEELLLMTESKIQSNDAIKYGFIQASFKKPIVYPAPTLFPEWLPIVYDELLNGGPFRSAILTGEGYAYYDIKRHIIQLIEAEREFLDTPKKKDTPKLIVDPLSLIDPNNKESFLKSEEMALEGKSKFDSAIRCAAFCELAYNKKCIKNTKTPRKTMIQFAYSRYKIHIEGALESSKKRARQSQQNHTSKNRIPLSKCFKGYDVPIGT